MTSRVCVWQFKWRHAVGGYHSAGRVLQRIGSDCLY